MKKGHTKRVTPIDVHVGDMIAHHRKRLDMSQSELGAAIGYTFQQVQKYEHGRNRVSAGVLWKIAKALGIPVNYFFEGFTEEA